MPEMKHTPGPWWIDKYAQVFTASGKPLLLTGVALTSGRHPQQEEAEANARLIAAAPDLLAACIATHKDGRSVLPIAAWDLMRDAIEKATGKDLVSVLMEHDS
jgi:hypothetical protein